MPFHSILCCALALAAAPPEARPVWGPNIDSTGLSPPSLPGDGFRYGRERHQRVWLTPARGSEPAPLIVWIGGGSDFAREATSVSDAWLPLFLFEEGYSLAYIGSRRDHEADPGGHAEDVAAGLAALIEQAERRRIDPSRIVLFGYGSGGFLAALLGTDPAYLAAAGVPFDAVRAVVTLNGDAFDLPGRIAASSRFNQRLYRKLFGEDEARHRALSPLHHLGSPNAPAFLFMAVDDGAGDFARQAEAASAALAAAGARTELRPVPRHKDSLGTMPGTAQHPVTASLRAFLAAALNGGGAAAEAMRE